MTVIPAERETDFETIAALAREIWTEHYTPLIGSEQVEYMLSWFQSADAVRKAVTEENTRYFIAMDTGEAAVGYAAAKLEGDKRLFLSKLYVRREARGTGFGRALLHTVIEAFPEADTVSLTVNKGNAQSIAAYQSMGFGIVRSLVSDIGGGFVMDDYVMELPIKQMQIHKGESQMSEVKEFEQDPSEQGRKKWADFIESAVVDFFSDNKLEKMSLEDGNGNKAKLGRTKDNEIKLEYSTTKLL